MGLEKFVGFVECMWFKTNCMEIEVVTLNWKCLWLVWSLKWFFWFFWHCQIEEFEFWCYTISLGEP